MSVKANYSIAPRNNPKAIIFGVAPPMISVFGTIIGFSFANIVINKKYKIFDLTGNIYIAADA